MKKIPLVCVVVMMGLSSSWAAGGYDDLAKLVKSKVSEDVIIAFINTADVDYALTPEDIINLKDMGASSKVITTAIAHKKPVAVEAANSAQPVVVPSENSDNSIDYESVPPSSYYPPSYYLYDGYWQDPADVVIYPGWRSYYSYHQGHSRDQGNSYRHANGANGGQRARTGGANASTTKSSSAPKDRRSK